MHFHHLHFYVREVAFWRAWFIHKLAFSPLGTQDDLSPIDKLGLQALSQALSQSIFSPSAQARTEPCTLAHRGYATTASPQALQGASLAAYQAASLAASLAAGNRGEPSEIAILQQGNIEIWLSSDRHSAEAQHYLAHHPPGLVDIGIATDCFDEVVSRSLTQGAILRQPICATADGRRQCQLQGWGDLRHTLIEVSPAWVRRQNAQAAHQTAHQTAHQRPYLTAIDHAVLNVPQGELDAAAAWYQAVFGLVNKQHFDIATAHSGLRSQVLAHPQGNFQLPINEPTSANSQIQEFLNHNRGAGIQHVALRSTDAIGAIAHMRSQGLELITVPATYYQNLKARANRPLPDTATLSQQQLLIDWGTDGDQGMLLQTFTKPIFAEPTFFFEIIERTTYQNGTEMKQAQGFGERNFQALFEAIEQAQLKRGSLM
jgi:4-hydroxyphenylpyruvate dioxygenase